MILECKAQVHRIVPLNGRCLSWDYKWVLRIVMFHFTKSLLLKEWFQWELHRNNGTHCMVENSGYWLIIVGLLGGNASTPQHRVLEVQLMWPWTHIVEAEEILPLLITSNALWTTPTSCWFELPHNTHFVSCLHSLHLGDWRMINRRMECSLVEGCLGIEWHLVLRDSTYYMWVDDSATLHFGWGEI